MAPLLATLKLLMVNRSPGVTATMSAVDGALSLPLRGLMASPVPLVKSEKLPPLDAYIQAKPEVAKERPFSFETGVIFSGCPVPKLMVPAVIAACAGTANASSSANAMHQASHRRGKMDAVFCRCRRIKLGVIGAILFKNNSYSRLLDKG